MSSRSAVPAAAQADLDAFFRHREDVPAASPANLIGVLSQLRGSDDPVVTFARLAKACVPEFADACEVELGDGAQPPFRVSHPGNPADGVGQAAQPASPDQVLLTPFRVPSRAGYPSYGGVITHWWTSRAPAEKDAVIADLMVKHAIALVDRERLMAAVGQAEDRAASLALAAISGRAICLATGIVMHEQGLPPGKAEDALRQAALIAGTGLAGVAASVVRSGSLGRPGGPQRPACHGAPPGSGHSVRRPRSRGQLYPSAGG
jgi:hypothetical protein